MWLYNGKNRIHDSGATGGCGHQFSLSRLKRERWGGAKRKPWSPHHPSVLIILLLFSFAIFCLSFFLTRFRLGFLRHSHLCSKFPFLSSSPVPFIVLLLYPSKWSISVSLNFKAYNYIYHIQAYIIKYTSPSVSHIHIK